MHIVVLLLLFPVAATASAKSTCGSVVQTGPQKLLIYKERKEQC